MNESSADPSGATASGPADAGRPEPTIEVSADGPYRVRDIEALVGADGEPLGLKAILALCRCGGSANKPFCDGTHKTLGFSGASQPDATARHEREYAADSITIRDRRWICSHAAECVGGLPAVFRAGQRPWVVADAASAEQIADVVARCPSGALSAILAGATEETPTSRLARITIEKNGPYRVSGHVTLRDPSGIEPPVAMRFTLCRCGQSQNKPFCDGTHRTVGFTDDGS
jgi:CDGSH-type Zn-finger protein